MVNLGNIGTLSLWFAFAALIGAAGLDLRSRKIPNVFNVTVFALALLFSLLTNHVAGLWFSLAGIGAALAIGLPAYLTKIFAGGDFKLTLAISPLLDWHLIFSLVLLSFIWGAVIGLIKTILSGELYSLLANMGQIARRKPMPNGQLHKMPYTVALLFGFLSALTLQQIGWEWI